MTDDRALLVRRLATLVVVTVGALLGAPLSAQRSNAVSEPAVKAAYLYQFGTYVEWPTDQIASFAICVLGDDPFGRSLDELVRGESIDGRSVVVRRFGDLRDVDGCRILFVSASEQARLPAILRTIDGKPILTVGDGAQFIRRGGMIAFTLQERKVRFAVNLAVAESARLAVSSQLLRHAVEVRQ